MENPIFIGLSRQIALKAQMDVIANNVANMSTPGYRGQNMVFTEYLVKPEGQEKLEEKDLSFVVDYGHYQSTDPGSLRRTDAPLDVALQGPGWLGVQTTQGLQYTRAGNFQINAAGELTTASGDLVADAGGGTIVVPADAGQIKITRDGFLTSESGRIGQLMVVEFPNVQELEASGNGYYTTEQQGTPAENTEVLQGMLEDSNVKPVLEMTRMIDVLRAYQSTQQMLQSEHERQRTMIQRLTRGS